MTTLKCPRSRRCPHATTISLALASAMAVASTTACRNKATPPPEPIAAPAPAGVVPAPVDVRAAAYKEISGFATPESVLVVPAQDYYLVSNINGGPLDVDDNGFISKVAPDGTILQLKWIDGASDQVTLHAPKGMAILGNQLYVADISTVRIFDVASGAPTGEVAIPGASFLNDMVAEADHVYVSDTGVDATFKSNGAQAIHKISATHQVTKVAGGEGFEMLNGLLIHEEQIWVASFGSKELFRVADGKKADVQSMNAGGLDGLDRLTDGRFVVSSWDGKAIFVGTPGTPFTTLIADVDAPADIAVDRVRKKILVPLFQTHTVRFYDAP